MYSCIIGYIFENYFNDIVLYLDVKKEPTKKNVVPIEERQSSDCPPIIKNINIPTSSATSNF